MAVTLRIADELGAYTITDDGTYTVLRDRLTLEVLIENAMDPILENRYSVMPINPARHPGVQSELAVRFTEWLISPETQARIAEYVVNGRQIFTPEG